MSDAIFLRVHYPNTSVDVEVTEPIPDGLAWHRALLNNEYFTAMPIYKSAQTQEIAIKTALITYVERIQHPNTVGF